MKDLKKQVDLFQDSCDETHKKYNKQKDCSLESMKKLNYFMKKFILFIAFSQILIVVLFFFYEYFFYNNLSPS